ncbi:MAG: threonine synthase, partial [Chloroflexi bacterium]|nr:threonine synthase [Chloroflexota bacterium]
MAYASALHCRECGKEYPIAPIHVCEWCFGPLEITYDYDAISRAISREKIKDGPP